MTNDELHTVAQYLYSLLDDIDTASDVAKSNDVYYRRMVEEIQAKKKHVVAYCDGYTVTLRPLGPN